MTLNKLTSPLVANLSYSMSINFIELFLPRLLNKYAVKISLTKMKHFSRNYWALFLFIGVAVICYLTVGTSAAVPQNQPVFSAIAIFGEQHRWLIERLPAGTVTSPLVCNITLELATYLLTATLSPAPLLLVTQAQFIRHTMELTIGLPIRAAPHVTQRQIVKFATLVFLIARTASRQKPLLA